MRDLPQPDVIVIGTPPALACDDLMSLSAEADAVLLVGDGTRTPRADIRACEALFAGRLRLLGVVLSRAQDRATGRYANGRRD